MKISSAWGSGNEFFSNVYFGFSEWFEMIWRWRSALNPKRTWVDWSPCTGSLVMIILMLSGAVKYTHDLNSLRHGRHFADDIFKCIFLNENVWISIKISLKFVPKGPINNIPALVQIMVWCRPGNKPLSEAMMVNLPTHICVSRPQWVKIYFGLKLF